MFLLDYNIKTHRERENYPSRSPNGCLEKQRTTRLTVSLNAQGMHTILYRYLFVTYSVVGLILFPSL